MARHRRLSAVAAGKAVGGSRIRGAAGRLILCWFVAGSAAVAAQDQAAEVVTGPVAIRSYQLLTPYELAGSGIDPEVEVRVDIDAAGAVAKVDILGIEPASEFDDLLRSHVENRVAGWRYGPARDGNGNAVASTLSWRMKFESPEGERRPQTPNRNFDPQLDVLVAAGGLPRPPRPLTPRERASALTRTVQVAEKYINREHRRRRETPRFILISDAETESTIDILAGNMESVFRIFHSIFDPYLEPFPQKYKIVVYLYASQSSMHSLGREVGVAIGGGGFYRSPGFMAFHQEANYFDQLLHSMLHEAFHAFSDSHLTGPGTVLPRWAEEGLAEYFGNSKIEKKRLVPGKTSHGMYAIAHGGGPLRLRSVTNWTLAEARSSQRNGEAPTIAELLEATGATFYGERYQDYYGFSWLLTHFLQHGRETWETEGPFRTMLLYLVEGYSGRDAMAEAFRVTPEELQGEFERYVRKF